MGKVSLKKYFLSMQVCNMKGTRKILPIYITYNIASIGIIKNKKDERYL